jgi:alkanesulfonate monooxygenase SsuD/methylene tetrahydromethanopterin reductase-like flavin-dependent oxidoreductase (luciferase family)
MSRMTIVGAVFLPQFAPERLVPLAAGAEAAGLAELWLWEDSFFAGGIASAAAALAATARLRVGVGILPVPLRNVALTAMELSALHRMFPGRPVVGVGHGVQPWMAKAGGLAASPLTLLGEHLDALRALLAGETVTVSGRYVQLDEVRLEWPPDPVPPVLAGAEGPRTLALAGARADGTILTGGTTPTQVARARTTTERPITVYVPTATGPTAGERIQRLGDLWGWESTVDRSVTGDAAAVAAHVARHAEAGADRVVLQPTEDDPDPAAFYAFAAEVGKLV